MNKEKLLEFCSKDETRFALLKPFDYGDFTYATDGRMIVRLPKLGYPSPDFTPTRESVENLMSDSYLREVVAFPAIPEPTQDLCKTCDGSGFNKKCYDCDGSGEVECKCCGNESDCKTCSGSGTLKATKDHPHGIPCEDCDGSGGLKEWAPVEIGGKYFSSKFLWIIKDLAGLVFMVANDSNAAARFTFDGGEGVLMPMSKPATLH